MRAGVALGNMVPLARACDPHLGVSVRLLGNVGESRGRFGGDPLTLGRFGLRDRLARRFGRSHLDLGLGRQRGTVLGLGSGFDPERRVRCRHRSVVTRTLAVPASIMPMLAAAAFDRSMMRPPMNGPRSLIRTTTERPLARFSTNTLVPNGSERCAAVSSFGIHVLPIGGDIGRQRVPGGMAELVRLGQIDR